MRIGIDARMYRSGVAGIGRYSQNLIKNLLELDKENQYVFFMTSEDKREFENSLPLVDQIENYKLKIVVVDIPHYSIAEQTKLPKIIEKESASRRIDLMHFLNFNYPTSYKGKFISVIHDLTLIYYPQTAKRTNFLKKMVSSYVMRKACQNSEKIIAVSKSTKKDIIKEFKIPENKIEVIYEAADDKTFSFVSSDEVQALKEKYHISKPLILYVGQFRFHKNIQGLIKAFMLLREETSCQLALLGKSDLINIDQKIIDKLVKKGDIIRPGFVSDKELACWYKAASVFAFPSFYEGFGLPGLEAMRAGTPVVASREGSLPEIYQDAAIYFDPFNPCDIADKIKEVLVNQSLQKDLVSKGQKVLQKYSWKKTAEETLKVYKEILKT